MRKPTVWPIVVGVVANHVGDKQRVGQSVREVKRSAQFVRHGIRERIKPDQDPP